MRRTPTGRFTWKPPGAGKMPRQALHISCTRSRQPVHLTRLMPWRGTCCVTRGWCKSLTNGSGHVGQVSNLSVFRPSLAQKGIGVVRASCTLQPRVGRAAAYPGYWAKYPSTLKGLKGLHRSAGHAAAGHLWNPLQSPYKVHVLGGHSPRVVRCAANAWADEYNSLGVLSRDSMTLCDRGTVVRLTRHTLPKRQ